VDGLSVPTLAERKRSELAANAESLEHELEEWLGVSAADQPLEKHNSQVLAAAGVLREVSAPILKKAGNETLDVEDAAAVEEELLSLHRVWDFFRQKLTVRFVEWLRDPLEAADELAWACYRPALDRLAADTGKEPPLIFPNGDASPFTVPRGAAFRQEPQRGEPLTGEELAEALEELPIPVIGVPWFQGEHLLGALVIGHEVGHDVEHALDLGTIVDERLHVELGGSKRLEAWLQWRGEAFADVYGTLAGGPAFVGALIDFLAAEWRIVAGRRLSSPNFGAYPTRPLRVAVALATLERLDFTTEAKRLRANWEAVYPEHEMEDYEEDVPRVVRCIVDGPYPQLGGGALTSLLTFTAEMQEHAVVSSDQLANGEKPSASDPRELFAAARLAFERKPSNYLRWGGPVQTVAAVRGLRAAGVRAQDEAAPSLDRPRRNARSAVRLAEVLQRAAGRRARTDGGNDV
jgi:hypothetical protein